MTVAVRYWTDNTLYLSCEGVRDAGDNEFWREPITLPGWAPQGANFITLPLPGWLK